jgi:putative PIN family toxin of toxin-antitoxin system
MLYLVIDTNVLLAAVGEKSPHNWFWKSFLSRSFSICFSTEILLEYEEIFKSRLSPFAANIFIEIITESPNAILCNLTYKWQLISSDTDDNKFVDAAIHAKADYIITQDRHFDVLKTIPFPSVSVLNIEQLKPLLTKI